MSSGSAQVASTAEAVTVSSPAQAATKATTQSAGPPTPWYGYTNYSCLILQCFGI